MPTTLPSSVIIDKITIADEFNNVLLPVHAAYPDQEDIATFDATTGWTVLGNDTLNLTTDLQHILGTASLEFDKVNGAANTKLAGVQKTLSPTLDLARFGPDDELQAYCYIPDKTNVDYAFIRLGTDASNYTEWQLADTAITQATWQAFHIALAGHTTANLTGNGCNLAAVAYVVVGLAFDAETDALANIYWDCLRIVSSRHTRT